ncbi:MAG TPA: hypothetical protein DEB62_09680 [Vibrio sp.]|nr:hypothetical protein [Vibrio sp.]
MGSILLFPRAYFSNEQKVMTNEFDNFATEALPSLSHIQKIIYVVLNKADGNKAKAAETYK